MSAPKDLIKYKKWIEKLKQRRLFHKPDCQCAFCKAKRGEYKGKNNPMYNRDRSGKNNGMYNKKQKQSSKNKIGKANIGEKSGMWKGDDVKNKHGRIVQLKGKASKYKCIDCGKQARDWSNIDHKYSLNPDDYLPRCRSCHRHYDYIMQKKQNRIIILDTLKKLLKC